MNEYDEINLGVVQVEYETQRERLNAPTTTNFVGTPTKKLGCVSVLLWLFGSMLILKAILEFFRFFL